MAKYIRREQLEKKTVTRHFAMKWSTSARVDFYLLERQIRACSYSEVLQRSLSKSSPLEQPRSKLANPFELSMVFDRVC